jgi:hypothetical protein
MKNKIKGLLDELTPEKKAIAKSFIEQKVQIAMLQQQVKTISVLYDDLFKLFIVILDFMPDQELRIHESQFLRFKEEYRIDFERNPLTEEHIYRLAVKKEPKN